MRTRSDKSTPGGAAEGNPLSCCPVSRGLGETLSVFVESLACLSQPYFSVIASLS